MADYQSTICKVVVFPPRRLFLPSMVKLTRTHACVLSVLPVLPLPTLSPQTPLLSPYHVDVTTLRRHSIFWPTHSPHSTDTPPTPPQYPSWSLPSLVNATFHSTNHPLNETDSFLTALAHAYPSNIILETVGLSAERRTIFPVAITRPRLKKKLRFVIIGTQHAREVCVSCFHACGFGWDWG